MKDVTEKWILEWRPGQRASAMPMPTGWVRFPPNWVPCLSNTSLCQVSKDDWPHEPWPLQIFSSSCQCNVWSEGSPCLSGSHDSFTYWVDVHAPVGPDQKLFVKYLATMFSVFAKKVMVKWSMTQVFTLKSKQYKMLFFFFVLKSVYFKQLHVFFTTCNNTVYSVIIHRIWLLKSSWMQESATLISGYPPNQVSLEMRSTSSMACLAIRWAEKHILLIIVAAVYACLSNFNIFKLTVVCCSYFIIPQNRNEVTVLYAFNIILFITVYISGF